MNVCFLPPPLPDYMQPLWSVRLKWTHVVSIGQVAGLSTASAAPFLFAVVEALSGLQDAMTTVRKTLVLPNINR